MSSSSILAKGALRAAVSRLAHGPRAGWSSGTELLMGAFQAGRAHEEARGAPFDWPSSRRAAEGMVPSSVQSRRATVEHVGLSRVSCELVRPGVSHDRSRAMLFLHAGGFTGGSARQHRDLVSRIAEAARCCALVPDYRLAPEHPFPAGLEDAIEAYAWLRDHGYAPAQIAIVGNSAGGGLAVSSLLALRDRGEPLPACAVLLSPWADLTLEARSLTENRETDYCSRRSLEAQRDAYVVDRDPRDPLISPVFADLRGLPPILCQTGGGEMLRDDGRALATRAEACGVSFVLDEAPGLPHVYQALAFAIPEAQPAIERLGAFVSAHTARPRTRTIEGVGAIEERRVHANGADLHVVLAGPHDGPLVVLLHGFPEHWWTFRHLVPTLAARGFRVAAIDQRGCGESSCPGPIESFGKEMLAKDVIAVIRSLGRERAHVVGHDWGGIVGWWLALAHPEHVERFVAISAPHPDVFAEHLKTSMQLARSGYVMLFQLPVLPELVLRARRGRLLETMLRASSRVDVPDAEIGVLRRAWLEPGRLEAMLAWYRAVLRAPAGPTPALVRPETLVVWGREDGALDAAMASRSADACIDGRAVVLDDVGHFVTWEAPDVLAALVIDHLGVPSLARGESRAAHAHAEGSR